MALNHNVVFRILAGKDAGLYRVVLNEARAGVVVVSRLDPIELPGQSRRGRKKLDATKNKRKKPPAPLVGKLIWLPIVELETLAAEKQLSIIEVERENLTVSDADVELFETRKRIMEKFLDFDALRDGIIASNGFSGLVRDALATHNVSEGLVYKLISMLCRFGFVESSLRPRHDRCGGKGAARPCDPGVRKKPGAKTTKQRVARAYGETLEPDQPGMSTEWRQKILAADKNIPSPKPPMPQRIKLILASHFVKRYRQEGNTLVAVDLVKGQYPNNRQISRLLTTEINRLQRLLDKTTNGHFLRSMRGMKGRNWEGVSGPGHTWAIDSTIGDIYLRSSINRAWIIGRPIVYVVVDIWSTAVVGFYVCLTGPSWDTAKVALFSAAAHPSLIGELWGYQPVLSLNPLPTMCAVLMCDRGEYLSRAAKVTGAKLIPALSYAPPYRPDLKGLVEVLHRIEKDRQYFFVPGAIDQRRKEFELRRFDPSESVLTMREFVELLYVVFTEYNLTADRSNRLDAHMRAAGVIDSPAGLWRAGHEMGIGVSRYISQSELVSELLPQDKGLITRGGVKFGGNEYRSEIVDEEQWTAYARNFGSWEVQPRYFPGSVSKIWLPHPTQNGLFDLQISDFAKTPKELTFEEAEDVFMYGKLNKADVQHEKTIHALQAMHRMQEIVDGAKALTAEAEAKHTGAKPSITESRAFETGKLNEADKGQTKPEEPQPTVPDEVEAKAAYLDMMGSILDAMNDDHDANE